MEMRIKYEQIQNKMKSTMKKPTPFERMKKLFSKHKEDKECHHKKSALTATNDSSTQRPISSLSTSSSGSSGRMSTISGCSLGDSGTLSDNEDRTVSTRKFETFLRIILAMVLFVIYVIIYVFTSSFIFLQIDGNQLNKYSTLS